MNFSTKPNNFFIPVKEKWWDRFTSQAHQLYFTSAIFFAITVMVLTFISFLGKIPLEFSLIHSFGLNYAVFTNAFLGFLITVIPKYNASEVISKNRYLISWFSFQIGVVLSLIGFPILGKIIVSFTMFYFVKIFYEIIKKGRIPNKKDSIFINLVFLFGAIFLLLEVVFQTNLSLLIFFAYLISLVFLVALRMVPAFYSAYMQIAQWEKPKYIREISVTIFLILGLSLEFELQIVKIVTFIAMVFFGYIVFKLNIYKKTPAIISILVLSFIWFEIGFIILFIESIFNLYSLKLALHIFALGFVTTLLIGFGSRVVMGHAIPAQRIVADKLTIFIFVLTQIVVLSRITASILFLENSNIFMGFLHLSSMLWIVLFLIWSFRYARTLLRIEK